MSGIGEKLRRAREAQGLSQKELALALRQADPAVATLGSLTDTIGAWECGRRSVSRRYQILLVSVLHRRPETLGFPPEDSGPMPANAGLLLPWTAKGASKAVTEVSKEDDMDRRTFLALGGAALTDIALDWLIASPSPAVDLDHIAGRRLLNAHVDELDGITGRLRSMDDQFGGGAVLDQAQAQVRHISALLRSCTYTEAVGQHLQCSAAELLRVTGWLAFDADHQALAQRYWHAGLRCAHAAGEDQLGANILGFLSCQAKDVGQNLEAVKFAEAAAGRHSGRSPRLTAILHMRAAQAYAATGQLDRCRAAVDDAGTALRSTAPARQDPDWAYWLNEPHWHEMVGYSWMKLESWGQAEEHLTASLADATRGRETALRQAFLGQVHAHQGEPERAAAAAGTALDLLLGDIDSDRVAGHVRKVSDALTPYDDLGCVRDFNERVLLLSA
jgi:transcriptional regulator with XRE-family HTH domain